MSANYAHNEVAIRCRVRIASIANINYGENREMTCVMLHGEDFQSSHISSLDENFCIDTSNNESYENHEEPSHSLEKNETTPIETNIGPKLLFKPVPRPPSRPQTQMIPSKEESKPHTQVDQATSLPAYHRNPGKVHVKLQSADVLDVQNTSRSRRIQSSSPSSARAAAMFAVKKGTVTDFVDDDETYAIPMNDVAAVNLKSSPADEVQTGTDLVDITTKHGGVLQISFYHHHEQDLLLGFLQAFLLPSVINIQSDNGMSAIPCIYRSESSRTMDMEKFEARAVTCSFLNESLWDKLKRRTSHWLSRTEEICC